jgi:hypothetical protein
MAVKAPRSTFQKLASDKYPVSGATATHTNQARIFDVKEFAKEGLLSNLYVRIVGNLVKGGATAGTATGRENPEALIRSITIAPKPAYSAAVKVIQNIRAHIARLIFDKAPSGFAVRATDIADSVATVAVDFLIPLPFKYMAARRPIEFALMLKELTQLIVTIDCGGRQELFTGGGITYDFSAINVELWADIDRNVEERALVRLMDGRRAAHLLEEYQQIQPITASQVDLTVPLESGYVYSDLLFLSERDNAVVDNIINDIAVESGTRVWNPAGQTNAAVIRRVNQELVLPSETLTGIYFVPLMRDGMGYRGADALSEKLNVKLNVTRTSGVENVTIHARRFKPARIVSGALRSAA